MTCDCDGKDGLELVICLSPPPGEHEIDIPISKNRSIIINKDGIFVRQLLIDETLPFAKTSVKPVDPGFIHRVPVKIDIKQLTCQAVESLVEASNRGSLVAWEKLEKCRSLVEKILGDCINP